MGKRELHINYVPPLMELDYFLKQFQVKHKQFRIFFRGKNFDFETFRSYSSDDDASTIDWVASARYDKLLVKQYREEEKQTVIFLIDTSENMVLGSGATMKCEKVGEIALSLADLVLAGDNRLGFVFFNKGIELFSPPMRGKRCFQAFFEALSDGKHYKGASNLNEALSYITTLPHYPVASLLIFSDFVSLNEQTKHYLSLASSSFEIISFMVRDLLDKQLPNFSGEFVLEDSSSGKQLVVDPQIARHVYEREMKKKEIFIKEIFKQAGIDIFEVDTEKKFSYELASFMQERIKLNRALL
jgi:uncharacterized protein (DUF58 family)